MKSIEIFKEMAERFDKRIAGLREEIRTLEQQKKATEEQYKQMMTDDATGVKEYSTEQLSKLKMRIHELTIQIQTANEQIEMLEKSKAEKMAEIIRSVQNEYREECAKIEEEIEQIFKEAREYRAKLTLTVLKAHEKRNVAYDLRGKLNAVERVAGVELTRNVYIPDHVPVNNVYTAYDYGVLPSEKELNDAYQQGKLQLWVEHYAETGEVTSNDELKRRPQSPTIIEPKTEPKGFMNKILGLQKSSS